MRPNHGPTPITNFRLIHDARQLAPCLPLVARARQIQSGLAPSSAVIDARIFQPDQTQADPPVPRAFRQTVDDAIYVRLQISRLGQTLAPPALLHVVVAQPHFNAADHLSIGPHLAHQMIRHAAQCAPHKFFVRRVLIERLLLTVGFHVLALGHDRTLIDPPCEFPQPPRPRTRDQLETLRRGCRHFRDAMQPRCLEHLLHLRPHARQPFYFEWREKFPLRSRRNFEKTIRLAQLRGHRGDQFVRPETLGDGQPQMIPDIFAQPLGRLARRPFCHPRKIPVALVDRPYFHHRRVVVDQRKHQTRKMLILFVITRQHDEVRTNLERPRRRHRRVNPEPPRLVTGRRNNPALHSADRHRLAAQTRLGRHLATDKKCIRIQMHRRPLFRPLHPADLPYPPDTVQMFSIIPVWPTPPRSHPNPRSTAPRWR